MANKFDARTALRLAHAELALLDGVPPCVAHDLLAALRERSQVAFGGAHGAGSRPVAKSSNGRFTVSGAERSFVPMISVGPRLARLTVYTPGRNAPVPGSRTRPFALSIVALSASASGVIVVVDASVVVAELRRRRRRELLAHPDFRVVVAEEQRVDPRTPGGGAHQTPAEPRQATSA